jgi:hypothetical protein
LRNCKITENKPQGVIVKSKINGWLIALEILSCIPIYIAGLLFMCWFGSMQGLSWQEPSESAAKAVYVTTPVMAVILSFLAHFYCKQRVNLKIFLILLIVTTAAVILTYVLVGQAFQSMAA